VKWEQAVNQSRQTLNQQLGKGNAMAADGRRILVIEDDPDISHLLEINLRDSAFRVDVVNNGVEGLERAANLVYQLIVLDLMLPGLDGLEICRRLRSQAIMVPILMLTAKTSEFDRVLGLAPTIISPSLFRSWNYRRASRRFCVVLISRHNARR
jgi:CheY-like chemotaxis protein